MGNSSNLIIQRSGISYIWFVYFVSSHNFFYFRDLTYNFFFLYKFFDFFFRKNFFKFLRKGFFFSHLKISVFKKNLYICNLYFFDYFYQKMCKFFLFQMFGYFGKNKSYFLKNNKFIFNKYLELRGKALYKYKKFYKLYPNFLKTFNIRNLKVSFNKSKNWFFFFKNFYKDANFFGLYNLNLLMFTNRFLKNCFSLREFLKNIYFFIRMVGFFDYKYETYNSQIKLYKYFFKFTGGFIKFINFIKNKRGLKKIFKLKKPISFNSRYNKNFNFQYNKKVKKPIFFNSRYNKNFNFQYNKKVKKSISFNSRYNKYGDVIKLRKIYLRDKYIEWFFLRFFIYFILRYKFRQYLFYENKVINKKFFFFLIYLLYNFLKKRRFMNLNLNLNFYNFFFFIKKKIIESKEIFFKIFRILYNIFFVFFFRRLLKLIFKKFYMVLIENLCKYFQMKIFTIFKLNSKIKIFFLSKYSLTPYILNNFFLYKLKKRFPFNELVKKFLFKNKNLYVMGLFVRGAGRFTKKQRTSLYKLQKGTVFLNSFNQCISYNMFTYISRYSICSIHFFFTYVKNLIFNKKLQKIKLR